MARGDRGVGCFNSRVGRGQSRGKAENSRCRVPNQWLEDEGRRGRGGWRMRRGKETGRGREGWSVKRGKREREKEEGGEKRRTKEGEIER